MQRTAIRNDPGMSSYFGGAYRGYGRYQWNIKFYGWAAEHEIESAQQWAFGDYLYSKGEFDYLNDVVGRSVKANIQGRSGGWLVIDTELSDAELELVDRHVAACMGALAEFLAEERTLHMDSHVDMPRD